MCQRETESPLKLLSLFRNQLMVLHKNMVILNERFAFKLNLRHSLTPFLRSIPIYKKSDQMPN